MSFNVYTGIKFRTKSFEKAVDSLKSIRKQALKNMANSLLHGNYIGLLVGLDHKMNQYLKEDIIAYKNDPSEQNLLKAKFEIIRYLGSRKDDEARLNGDLDYSFQVMIYPYHGNLYGNYFGCDHCQENRDLIMTIVDDYWYGDSGDPDPDLSWQQWKQRSKVWNGIFDEYWKPTENGAVFYIAKWDWLDWHDIPDELIERLTKVPMFNENNDEK